MTLNQHRAGVTQALIDLFKDSVDVKSGFEAFFPSKTTRTKAVKIEVQREGRKVAVDVLRCTNGNRNKFSRSTEKIFIPPFYKEFFDFTSCESYDVSFGIGTAPNETIGRDLLTDAQEKLNSLKNKIKRAIELQRSQVLQTGIVQLKNGDNIDFKRKAESIVTKTVSGEKWTATTTSDPVKDLQAGCEFLRQTGKSGSGVVNAIMGANAFNNYKLSNKVKEEADIRNINRGELNMPILDGVSGLAYQGQVGAGDFIVNIWTYNETYENENGDEVRYLDTNTVVMLPLDFKGWTAFAGLPAVMGDAVTGQFVGQVESEYMAYDVIDQVKMSWEYYLMSAPLVVPVSVDRIYTLVTTS